MSIIGDLTQMPCETCGTIVSGRLWDSHEEFHDSLRDHEHASSSPTTSPTDMLRGRVRLLEYSVGALGLLALLLTVGLSAAL